VVHRIYFDVIGDFLQAIVVGLAHAVTLIVVCVCLL
jgi:hypothetical protein